MSDVHDAARRLEPLFSGSPSVDWDNANRDVIADLVTLARDWFERRDSMKRAVREILDEYRMAEFEAGMASCRIDPSDYLIPANTLSDGIPCDYNYAAAVAATDKFTGTTSTDIRIPGSTDIET